MSTPTPAPGLTPSYQGQGQGSPQSVNSNINQFMGSTASQGGAYFGTSTINPQLTEQEGHPVYGVYDPTALFAMQFSATGNNMPIYINTTNATNMYYEWNQNQQDAFRAKMALVDSTALTATDAQMASAWAGLVNQSAAYAAAGQNVTPWDVLAKDIASNNGGKGKYQGTQTRNIQTVTHASAADANAIFTSAAQALLGRAPTADELTSFRNNLYGLESANPTNQTIEETFNPQGFMIDKNVLKSSGGIGAAAQQNLALQQAKTNPEYGAYQAATTYMGALQELLGGGKV